MLQISYTDSLGETSTCLGDSQLGFSIGGAWDAVSGAVSSGASSVAGGVVDAANAAGSSLVSGLKSIPAAAGAAAKMGCGVVRNSTVQQGISYASKVPNPYSQGVSQGAAVGTGICNMAYPPSVAAPTAPATAPKLPVKMFIPVASTATATPGAPKLPAGSIQWKSPQGVWTYAAPKGTSLGVATIAALNGGLGAQGFISPWLRPDRFTSPYDIAPGQYKNAYWRRQHNWYDTNTADSPYRATWGVGATHTIVGTGTAPNPGATTVSEGAGKKATAPIYKKWWFWLAIAGGTAALGTGGYFIATRKR